jgi:hypothetical protein
MAIELIPEQARLVARLRLRHPGAELRAHQRPWGVIVEVREGSRTIALVALDASGGVLPDAPLPRAA